MGIDNLFSIFGQTGRQGLRAVLRNVARQAGIEASEEAISEVLNTVADTAIMRENSTYEQSIANYMAQGMTRDEATGAANRELLTNIGMAALGGGLSGGILGGGASLVNRISNRNTQQTPQQEDVQFRVTLPTAEQGGRLPGGETVQTEQQAPTVQQDNTINLPTADEWLNGQLSRRQPVVEFTGNLNQEQSQALGRMMSSGQVSVDADNNLYQVREENHIDQRDMGTVGDKRVKAFQFDNPTLHDYFSGAAQDLLNDLADTIPAERWSTEVFNPYSGAVETVWNGTRRATTDQIATLKDDQNLSYADIQQAAEAIIQNHGQENYAAAKRVELVLDDMLTNGWRDVTGRYHEPNQDYINAKRQIPGAAQEAEHVDNLADIDVMPGEQNNTASTGEAEPSRMTMQDFTNVDSPVWNNVSYDDTETQAQIMQSTHRNMVDAGEIVRIPESTLDQVGQSYPDLRTMNKSERTPILRQKMNELKASLRQFLNGLKGGNYEFEVNGNVLEARLYDTGVREVMEKITQDKASMLYHSDEIFQNARYLYSTPDYEGNPNIYRWNYFYTPVQIGNQTVGVRIAVRDMVPSSDGRMDSQIYNWGIRTGVALDGGGPGTIPNTTGISSATPSNNNIPQTAQNVNTQVNENASDVGISPIIQRLSRALGREIQVYDGSRETGARGSANGYYANGTIYVNSQTSNPIAQVVAHELTHSVEMADAYRELSALVMDRIRQTGGNLAQLRAQKADLYRRNGVELNQQDLDAEIVAEYVEKNLLTDEASIAELTRTNRTLAQKIRDWIDTILAKLGNSDAQSRVFLERARDAYSRALQQSQSTVDAVPVNNQINLRTYATRQRQSEMQALLDQYDSGSITLEQLLDQATPLIEQEMGGQYSIGDDSKYSISEYTDQEKQDLDYFGRTYNWNETGYITRDGSRVDLSGKHEGGPGGYRAVDHRDISDALGDDYGDGGYSGAMIQFISEGNIRISPESGGIDLSVQPTRAQEQALADFISRNRGEVILDIDRPNGDTVASVEYPRGTHSTKVINDIRNYFSDGTIPQVSEVSRFRYSLDENQRDQFVSMLRQYARGNWNEQTIRQYLDLVNQHGAYDQGANAARPVIVPQRDSEGNPVSRTARTVMGARAIPEEVAADIANLVRTGQMSYERVTDRDSILRANERISRDGFDRSLNYFKARVRQGAVSKDLVTLGQQLLIRAANSGDGQTTTEILELYTQLGTSTAQAEQAFSILRKLYANNPAYLAAHAEEILNGENIRRLSDGRKKEIIQSVRDQAKAFSKIGNGDTDALINLIERNNEIRRTTGLLTKKTAKTLDSALRYIAKTYPDAEQFLRDVALTQIRNIPLDYQKLSPVEAVKSYRVTSMLSKISTIMRNLVSNNIFDPLESLSNNVGLISDAIMSKSTGRRTTALDKSWFSQAKRSGSLEGALKSYVQVALDASTDGAASRYDTGSTRTFKMTGNPLERLLSTWSKYQGYTLNTTDEFQKGGIRAEQQRGIDQLKASGQLEENALENWADETARQRTFQNDGMISEAMNMVRQGMNRIGVRDKKGGSFGVGDVMLPFARVPANLVSQAGNYSPAGLANSLRQMIQVLLSGKNATAEQQAQAARNFGRGVTGFAFLAGFGALAAKGLISVAGSDDEDQEALERAQGRTGTQWNLSATLRALTGGSTEWQDDDILMSIGFLDPINSIMAAGALIADDLEEEGGLSLTGIAEASFSSLVQSVLDLPAMSSISDLINEFDYAEGENTAEKTINALLGYGASQASSFVPNFIRGIATGIDNTVRNQYAGENVGEDALNSILASTPGARGLLPASLDNFGRERTYTGNPLLNFLNANILPGQLGRYSETDLEQELSRLYDATGNGSIFPDRNAPGNVSYGNVKYELTAEEKDAYQTTRGQTAQRLMESVMGSDAYQNASAEEQADMLADVVSFANDMAKRELLTGRGVDYKSNSWEKVYSALDILEGNGADAGDVLGAIFEVRNADGEGYEQSNNKRTALANSGLSDGEKAVLYHYLISDSRDDDIQAFDQAGLSFNTFLEAQNKYAEINDRYDSAGEKSVEFSRWVNHQGFTSEQRDIIKNSFKYFSQIPQDASYYEKLTDAGVDDETAYEVNNAISDLEPLDGEDKVTSLQRYRAVIDTVPDVSEQLSVLETVMGESEYKKVNTGYSFGVSPNAYVTVKEILPQFDQPNDSGNYGTYTQEEYEAALDSLSTSSLILPGDTRVNLTNDQKAVLWQLLTGSSSAKNNPYSVRIGNQVLSALEAAKNAEDEGANPYQGLLNLPMV